MVLWQHFNVHRVELWFPLIFIVNILLLSLFFMMRKRRGYFQDRLLRGDEADYANVVSELSEALTLTLDRQTLKYLLLEKLAVTMKVPRSALFLKEQPSSLRLVGCMKIDFSPSFEISLCGNLAVYLETISKPVSSVQIRQQLNKIPMPMGERRLLFHQDIFFWLPLISAGSLQGLLLLGAREADGDFRSQEERILVTLGQQAGIAAHNVYLIEEVESRRQELARAHQQLLMVREHERQQIARWLHDSVVQQLLGISYQLLVNLRQQTTNGGDKYAERNSILAFTLETAQQAILDVVRQLRQLIGELRPAGLEELGLAIALEGYVTRLKREGQRLGMPMIELDLDPDITSLPDTVAICLFCTAQESLRNALKHAGARKVKLSLFQKDGEIFFIIRDNGKGFQMPAHLSEFVWSEHFGLVGMAERIAWVGGHLTINSEPGDGTEIIVRIPLLSKEKNDGPDPCVISG